MTVAVRAKCSYGYWGSLEFLSDSRSRVRNQSSFFESTLGDSLGSQSVINFNNQHTHSPNDSMCLFNNAMEVRTSSTVRKYPRLHSFPRLSLVVFNTFRNVDCGVTISFFLILRIINYNIDLYTLYLSKILEVCDIFFFIFIYFLFIN